MNGSFFLNYIGPIILLVVVLTYSFYLLYPMVNDIKMKNKLAEKGQKKEEEEFVADSEEDALSSSTSDDSLRQQNEKRESCPVVTYSDKANAIRDENNRIDDIVNRENMALAVGAMPSYEDDPTSIDLQDLLDLKKAIKTMTRELTIARRSNADLQRLIKSLKREHEDALNRVVDTDLWEAEKRGWQQSFAVAFREYESQKASLPPKKRVDNM